MIKIIYVLGFIVTNITTFFWAYAMGIKTEQRARIRRLNILKRLLNGKV